MEDNLFPPQSNKIILGRACGNNRTHVPQDRLKTAQEMRVPRLILRSLPADNCLDVAYL